jgi:hypothetical protein
MADKYPKWLLDEAIEAGKSSVALLETYTVELTPRMRTDEAAQHKANVTELKVRKSGQKQTLSDQKSKTKGQEAVIGKVNTAVIDVRTLVKAANADEEKSKAFGVGEKISLTVSGVTAASNIILDGYKRFPEWSKEAGIIETDITEIKSLVASLDAAEELQDDSVFARKAKTMSKNALQREVEDEVTRLSAFGAIAFRKSNPALAEVFESLIPATSSEETTETKTDTTVAAEKAATDTKTSEK